MVGVKGTVQHIRVQNNFTNLNLVECHFVGRKFPLITTEKQLKIEFLHFSDLAVANESNQSNQHHFCV